MKGKLAAILLVASTGVFATEYVPGYLRSDGVWVDGHFRSSPNSTTIDNYSTRGNVNPYTGEKGYVDPYKAQTDPYRSRTTKPRTNSYDYEYKQPSYDYGTQGQYPSRYRRRDY